MKKTIIAFMGLAGVAMAEEEVSFSGTFNGTSFVTSGKLEMSSIICSTTTFKTPSYLGDGVPAGTTYLAPDQNMSSGSWNISFTLTNKNEEAITLRYIMLDSFIFTSGGTQHENDGKPRYVSFTLNALNGGSSAALGSTEVGFTWKVAQVDEDGEPVYNDKAEQVYVNYRYTDADATIALTTPLEISAGGSAQLQLVVSAGSNGNGGSFVGLKGATFSNVPEPTTATLSLLALAGLAARRRRR
ncbi:MAG: PEP-CTERM sorting domain-containing protein [Akkermansia sp.]|nr:PEP-CTERM sorting domain-containing protein [Akkermansia sp.]